MNFKIQNFRAGFATNSSSSHSIVLLPTKKYGITSKYDIDSYYGPAGFGSENFRLCSEQEKMRYLATILYTEFDEMTSNFAKMIQPVLAHTSPSTKQFFETQQPLDTNQVYIDHESQFTYDTLTPGMVRRLIAKFTNPYVAVYGGRDGDFVNQLPSEHLINYYDENKPNNSNINPNLLEPNILLKHEGNRVVIMDTTNGNKLRFTMADDDEPWTKSLSPELVDVKITNFCAKGCNFCYQSSTKDGKHAPVDEVKKIIDLLIDAETFEIAIGGGEPTDHPDLIEIMQYARDNTIIPNLTTYTTKWVDDPVKFKAIMTLAGGIGVSCHSSKDFAMIDKIVDAVISNNGFSSRFAKIMAQHVVGSVPFEVTEEVLRHAFKHKYPILLLGYKPVGFGAEYIHDSIEAALLIKLIYNSKNDYPDGMLSVDTAFLELYPNLCAALEIPTELTTSPEGKFSCYIDATTKMMAPSSYCDKTEYHPLPNTLDDFKKLFQTF